MKQTPLLENHKKLGAKLTPFAGYTMPVWYSDIKTEHHAVRNDVGVFDISHMQALEISGEGAKSFLQWLVSNDIERSSGGKMIYAMILNNDGGILDDVMVGEMGEDQYLLIVNASNAEKIASWIDDHKPSSVNMRNMMSENSLLAIQGPKSIDLLTRLFGDQFKDAGRFSLSQITIDQAAVIAMRTGYTGEDGYELLVPNTSIVDVWNAIIDDGAVPCGLGARDTLRMEAGLPLYGQELSEDITPLMTRYKWVMRFGTGFNGEAALKDSDQKWITVGLKLNDKLIPRKGYAIEEGGSVTSGTLSPSLGVPIAMAMVPIGYSEPGTQVTVVGRGRSAKATVTSLPLIKK